MIRCFGHNHIDFPNLLVSVTEYNFFFYVLCVGLMMFGYFKMKRRLKTAWED